MTYYEEKRKANIDLRNEILKAKHNNETREVNKLVLILTERYAISEKSILDRLELLKDQYEFSIVDGVIKWV